MDNPGASLFQGTDIKLNNSQNDEEEDLEEQIRRKEELQNLLTAKLDDFNYDESTIHSSTNISVASLEDAQKNYQDAIDPAEQLKILYDVRVREITKLKEEYNQFKTENLQEIESLKKKLYLQEAEIHQLKISSKSQEELLVEKTATINELSNELKIKEEQITNCKKDIENFQFDIDTYQSTINELQLKLQTQPFNYGTKKFHSEELARAHQEQITKLEDLLDQQTKAAKLYERDKQTLQQELEKLINISQEDTTAINVLTKNFDSAQKQCQELIELIEKLSTENKHLRDRLNMHYSEVKDDSINKKSPRNADASQIEKLRKMLVDKSVEIDALSSKLKSFENNIRELIEYREMKSDVYKKEFQQCENKEHTKSLILMQNDLQNYRRTIEDKNQQILTLNSTNKDLLEKMEDMLSQTRNDIQNFSHKYNLPQLEKMAKDLNKAEERIKELEIKLEKSEERRQSLQQKVQRRSRSPGKESRTELEHQLDNIKQQIVKDKNNFENDMKRLRKELEISSSEIQNLKLYIDQLIEENTKLKTQLKTALEKYNRTMDNMDNSAKSEGSSLKYQYAEIIKELNDANNRIKILEETVEDLNNTKTILEGEKCSYQYQLKDCQSQMEKLCEAMPNLEKEISELTRIIEDKNTIIKKLQQNPSKTELEMLQKELSCKDNALKISEENKQELIELLEKLNNELEESKKQLVKLQQQLVEVTEKNVKRNLAKELKEAESAAEHSKREEDMEAVDHLRVELKLREEIQQEYLQKIKEIEKNYQKSCLPNKDLYKELTNKLKTQESWYREQWVLVLNECADKMKILEDERDELLRRLNSLQQNFEQCKAKVIADQESYEYLLKGTRVEAQRNTAHWERWSKKLVSSCLKVETINKNSTQEILHKMGDYDKEVAAIEKSYNDKIRKYVKKCKI